MKKMKTAWKVAPRRALEVARARSVGLVVSLGNHGITGRGGRGERTCCQDDGQEGTEEETPDDLPSYLRVRDSRKAIPIAFLAHDHFSGPLALRPGL